MGRQRAALLAAFAALLALPSGCGAVPSGGGSPSPSAGVPALADLKYRLIAQVGPVFFCDPDLYPVARPVSDAEVLARVESARSASPDTYSAVLRHLGLDGVTPSPAQERAVYQDLKMLDAVGLTPAGDAYDFDYAVGSPAAPGQVTEARGSVDRAGRAVVRSRAPRPGGCPICLAAGTPIATPAGAVPVERLRPGAVVWSRDRAGARVAVPVVAVGRAPAPPGHLVVRLALDDGRTVEASPGHPTADGRRVGDLVPGDRLDGGVVVSAGRVPYRGTATYDILPAGETGAYWAGGIPLASTLAGPPAIM